MSCTLDSMSDLLDKLTIFGSSAGIAVVVAVLIYVMHQRMLVYYANKPAQQHYRQLIMACVVLIGLILTVLIMPVGDEMRGQLLSFMGILLSATIALSSTTLVGNAMAGLMLRSLRNCHVGDYIKVGEHFGRISQMDLLHVEIQTEDRDLTTLPNLYLVTSPVTVLRDSGTLLHVEVSLGYDVPRQKIEAALLRAAEDTGLESPFVQIISLGDFSISYRVSGLLTDVSKLLTMRRKLRAAIVDALHDARIEIVSPNFMNTRALKPNAMVLPEASPQMESVDDEADPDAVVFDKAAQAEELEDLKRSYTEDSQRLLKLEQELKDAGQGDERRPLLLEKKKLEAALARLGRQIEQLNAELHEDKK